MNTGFKIGILIMGVLMLACCGGAMMMLSPVTSLIEKREREARDKGDTYARQILRKWDAAELVSLSTPEYKKSFTTEEFQKTLDGNHKALGEFQSGRGSASIKNAERLQEQQTVVADYANDATFSNGKAMIKMKLKLENNVWSIQMFAIEPN